ncbi:MAG: PD40 domain-containing protein [Bacteroidia bacterium]|nr:PD40 domain-containing protein [Bacteroidia bacterium]
MKSIIIIITIFIAQNCLYSQVVDKKKYKKLFKDAEYYFLYENYAKALPLYLEIFEKDTFLANNNANLNYKIGNCYLENPLKKSLAYPYLERAVKSISFDYPIGTYKEFNAPIEAYYLLGDAYRCIFEFDKAIEAYMKFLDIYQQYKNYSELEEELYNTASILNDIQACKNAKELLLLSAHNTVRVTNLGNIVNTEYPEYNPVVSGDESTLIFTSKRRYDLKKIEKKGMVNVDDEYFEEEIFFSRKENKKWTTPVNISYIIGADFYTTSVSISYDGMQLFVAKFEVEPGNIENTNLFSCKYKDGNWTQLEELNNNINTRGFESQAYLSKDGKTLFFTSDREGGFGGMDIYKSELDASGDWGPALNLGPYINTAMDEAYPFILSDGKTLYFSSQAHYNMGGFDIFYSKLDEKGRWMTPINVGFPINSMEDNMFLMPVGDGTIFYTSLVASGGFGNEDIYRITLSTTDDDQLSELTFDLAQIRDESYGHTITKIIPNFDKQLLSLKSDKSQVEILKDTKNITYNDINIEINKDLKTLDNKANELKQQAGIAFLLADEKNRLANKIEMPIDPSDTASLAEKRKKEDLIAIMTYNIAAKLDNSALEISEQTRLSGEFAASVSSDTLSNLQLAASKLNNNKEVINNKLNNSYSIHGDINETKLSLGVKSSSLDNYKTNLINISNQIDENNQQIQKYKTEINELKKSIEAAVDRSKIRADKKKIIEINSNLKMLDEEHLVLENKNTNTITDIKKLNDEINTLGIKLIVLDELSAAIVGSDKTNQELAQEVGNIDKNLLSQQISEKKKNSSTLTTIVIPTDETAMNQLLTAVESNVEQYKDIEVELLANLTDTIKAIPSDSIGILANITDTAEFIAMTKYLSADTTKLVSATDINIQKLDKTLQLTLKSIENFTKYLKYVNFEIPFDDGDFRINRIAEAGLNDLVSFLTNYPAVKVKLEISSQNLSPELTDKRAESVIANLASKNIELTRIYGPGKAVSAGMASVNLTITADDSKYIAAKADIIAETEETTKSPDIKETITNPVSEDVTANTPSSTNEVIISDFLFGFDKDETDEYLLNIEKLAVYLVNNKDAVIEIVGYSDLQGDENYNLTLSVNRARYIKGQLIEKGAIAQNIRVGGMGESVQISSDINPASRKYNRRAEINVIKQGSVSTLKVERIKVPDKYRI